MCTTCGCSSGGAAIETSTGAAGAHSHGHSHSHPHEHSHPHDHEHAHGEAAKAGAPPAPAHPEPHAHRGEDSRIVAVERDLLARNDARAARNRAYFAERGIFALNLVSSPGSGKTSLLVRTAQSLREELGVSVIEGDQQTSRDAERIRAAGVPGIQVNTGKGCHLDADMVARALETLEPADGGVLFIENVGNLVCPAAFDLGEAHKVVVVSTTEGEDKPLKYPDMIAASDLMLVNKIDLLPHLDFDVDRCIEYARRVKPGIRTLRVSATTGEGFEAWLEWVRDGQRRALTLARPALGSAS